jgi:hypothetical protein
MWAAAKAFFRKAFKTPRYVPAFGLFGLILIAKGSFGPVYQMADRQGVVWTGIPDGRAFPFPNGLPFPALSAGGDTPGDRVLVP